ncbi:MAG: OB fold protein [Promethearchaeota archaeon]|jgi:uncharacterized protein YdeI (BOF family)|nr:MAG: OB fold protein [Candidatus Lokiarchaeota archaeon]
MENQFAKQRIINDIQSEDLKIQVTGYVKEVKNNDYIILDDKSGQIKVALNDLEIPFGEKDLINVIGELQIKTSGEKVIMAQIIQDMNTLNFKYYRKLYDLKKELLEK